MLVIDVVSSSAENIGSPTIRESIRRQARRVEALTELGVEHRSYRRLTATVVHDEKYRTDS
jgi:hypothetical protein